MMPLCKRSVKHVPSKNTGLNLYRIAQMLQGVGFPNAHLECFATESNRNLHDEVVNVVITVVAFYIV